jgi:hypothetical protein
MTSKAVAPQPLRPRHVPQRTCVGCRTTIAKRELVRIVRTPSGKVEADPTGKKPGRGAYLHRDPECWDQGLRKGKLARALKTTLSPTDIQSLQAFLAGEPPPPANA